MNKEFATFALGCFWGPEEFYANLKGVSDTRVGYTGGTSPDPTYEKLGDHTEAVEITYNPEKISYEELLEHFWEQHDPTIPQKTQYRSAIFYHDNHQRNIAEHSKHEMEDRPGTSVTTTVSMAPTFHEAEDYHQRFIKKNR